MISKSKQMRKVIQSEGGETECIPPASVHPKLQIFHFKLPRSRETVHDLDNRSSCQRPGLR